MAGPVILVVDDNEDTVNSIKEGLKKFMPQAEIVGANDASQALDLLRQQHINLILLDIRLPGVGGESFCQLLRSKEEFSKIPVIFLSAISGELTEKYRSMGVIDYIEKPFQMFDLKKRVEKALENE